MCGVHFRKPISLSADVQSTSTTDAGSGSSHRCRIMSGRSTTLTMPTMTYTEIHWLRRWIVGGVWVQLGSRDKRTGSIFDVFSFLSSVLFFFRSRPSTNDVCTGYYHLLMEVEFPRAPDPPKGLL